MWIGTRGGGLDRWKDGRFTSFTTKNGLSDDLVFAIHEDAQGSLWIGTYGGGLNRHEGRPLHRDHAPAGALRRRDPSHRRGRPRRRLDELQPGRSSASPSGSWTKWPTAGAQASRPSVYGTADGMKSAECNGGANSGGQTRDGKLWFPTIRGVVRIDPDHLPTNPLRPPVAIEEVKVDERVGRHLRRRCACRPARLTFEVHYTALSLAAPARVRFRYRLEGFDEAWVEAGTRRAAYYTRLPHGTLSLPRGRVQQRRPLERGGGEPPFRRRASDLRDGLVPGPGRA